MDDVGELEGELARRVGLDRDPDVAAGATRGAQPVELGLRGGAGAFGLDPPLRVPAPVRGHFDELRGDGRGHLRDARRIGRALGKGPGQPVAGAHGEPLQELLARGVARVGAVDRGERALRVLDGLLGSAHPVVGRADEVAAHHVHPDHPHRSFRAPRHPHRIVEQHLG